MGGLWVGVCECWVGAKVRLVIWRCAAEVVAVVVTTGEAGGGVHRAGPAAAFTIMSMSLDQGHSLRRPCPHRSRRHLMHARCAGRGEVFFFLVSHCRRGTGRRVCCTYRRRRRRRRRGHFHDSRHSRAHWLQIANCPSFCDQPVPACRAPPLPRVMAHRPRHFLCRPLGRGLTRPRGACRASLSE